MLFLLLHHHLHQICGTPFVDLLKQDLLVHHSLHRVLFALNELLLNLFMRIVIRYCLDGISILLKWSMHQLIIQF